MQLMSRTTTPAGSPHRRLLALLSVAALTASIGAIAAAPVLAQDDEGQAGSVVATTEVLGSLVGDLVGDAAEVTVLMSGGTNPHTFEPSARDAERVLNADVVVSNGLELEEGLISVLETAADEGVTWFEAAEHIAVLEVADDDAVEADHGHDADDPHIWTDPLVMRDVITALEPVLAEAGIEVSGHAANLVADLEALDGEVAEILAVVPRDERKLVTGHRSLGYFAERYGFELIGTVIPSLSTSGEPTARELAQLINDIRDNEVPAVFTEVGTPQSVAQAVAQDSGAELVTLSTSQLPEDGSYADLIRELATTIAAALVG
jgi:zinc/manganese transport system substrate-binding protein